MTTWLGDPTLAHLRDVAEWPDAGERYEVTGRLGRGGMAVVYAARDRLLDRDVAIKVVDAFGDAARPSRHDESKILARLEHPGIVPVHDSGTLPDGRAFYVMKLVRGTSLDVALQRQSALGERLDLFVRICDAVSFAHARGIVHRDLKPANVMCGEFGEVLVMDWGVAKLLNRDDGTVAVVGTAGYMPPEQAAADQTVDHRADVFALGVILGAMLAEPAPRALRAVAMKARADRAENRYATVAALARDIGAFRDGQPVTAYRESLPERLGRVYTRYRLPIVLVLTYMVLRTILLMW
ncbi:MAG TPA: serine/threonine-protein kinase [Vicinamibacterales bacterium]|nr:serine/threonine-protein kinase [Vicinamibacterales bacterium]